MGQSRAFFEPIKSLAFGGISAAYASVGTATTHPVRVFKISNDTQGNMMFTTNTAQDEMFLPAGSFTLYDVQANINPRTDDSFVLETGTQFSVKQITAPVSGSVYIECIF
jgi:hypothetical protein